MILRSWLLRRSPNGCSFPMMSARCRLTSANSGTPENGALVSSSSRRALMLGRQSMNSSLFGWHRQHRNGKTDWSGCHYEFWGLRWEGLDCLELAPVSYGKLMGTNHGEREHHCFQDSNGRRFRSGRGGAPSPPSFPAEVLFFFGFRPRGGSRP